MSPLVKCVGTDPDIKGSGNHFARVVGGGCLCWCRISNARRVRGRMAGRRFFLWVLLIVSNISSSAPFVSPALPSVTITTASGQYTLRGESGAVLGLDVHAAVMSQRGLGVGTRSRAGRGEAACGLRCVSSTSPSLSSHGLGRKPTSTLVAMQPCSGRYGSRAVQRAGWVGLFAKKKGGDGEKKLSKV
jgi:hypothetical protein